MIADFFHSGWSVFVAAATIAGMVFCLALLVIAARRKVVIGADGKPEETTGHVYDGIVEMNNPLPRWWMVLFVGTVVASGIYLVLYPGLGSAEGTLNWSSVNQYDAEQERARAAMASVYEQYASMDAPALARDSAAMGIGERLFINNCATCHGSDARGSKSFPNLTDSDWLYGGSHETIKQSITDGRQGVMPPMAAAVGTAQDVRNVAHYVLSLSGSPHNSVAAQLGRSKFGACAACHGADGKGNQALGAPNLTDRVWLHGWGEAAIVAIINDGKTNVMPAQAGRLTPEQIHVLGAYVWNLSQSQLVATTK